LEGASSSKQLESAISRELPAAALLRPLKAQPCSLACVPLVTGLIQAFTCNISRLFGVE